MEIYNLRGARNCVTWSANTRWAEKAGILDVRATMHSVILCNIHLLGLPYQSTPDLVIQAIAMYFLTVLQGKRPKSSVSRTGSVGSILGFLDSHLPSPTPGPSPVPETEPCAVHQTYALPLNYIPNPFYLFILGALSCPKMVLNFWSFCLSLQSSWSY